MRYSRVILRGALAVACILILYACTALRQQTRSQNSLVGVWTAKPTYEELTMQSDAASSFSTMLPKGEAQPRWTDVADDWEFDPNGRAVSTMEAIDRRARHQVSATVGTYVCYGNEVAVNWAMSVTKSDDNNSAVPMGGSQLETYKVEGDRLTFSDSCSTISATQIPSGVMPVQVFHRVSQ